MSKTPQKRVIQGLGAFQVFIGLGGIGGMGLVMDPSGTSQGLPLELLAGTPFRDYLVPGLVLLLVIGLGTLGGGVLSFRGYPSAGMLAAILGAVLMGWIAAQVWWIGLVHWLQPLYFSFGVLELVVGVAVRGQERS